MADIAWSHAIERAVASFPGLETWEGHFHHRLAELEEVSSYWPERRVDRALEIGCGNGLAAIYFSPRAGHIVASDLAVVDVHAHSVGLGLAKDFIQRMNVSNVDVLGCSAESIPLPDRGFDLVYGIYCLEHIPDRPKALREVLRVLKPDGLALLTVPGFSWALIYPFSFYWAFGSRVLKRILRKLFPREAQDGGAAKPFDHEIKVTSAASFRQHYPHFPAPEPHGAHASWVAELLCYRLGSWRRTLEEAGFTDVRVEAVSYLPEFTKGLLPESLRARINRWLLKFPCLTPFAQYFCLLGRRPVRRD